MRRERTTSTVGAKMLLILLQCKAVVLTRP